MEQPRIQDKEYLSLNEVCKYLGVAKTTIYHWRAQGLEIIRIGGRVFYSKKLIDTFMHRHKIGVE